MASKAWDLICFESHGIPVSLHGENSARRAIANGSLTRETSVVQYSEGVGVRMPAMQVPQLRKLFDPDAGDPIPARIAPPEAAPAAPSALETRKTPPPEAPPPPPPMPVARSAGVTLPPGANISLDHSQPGVTTVFVGLGWDPSSAGRMDLDAIVFIQGSNGRVRSDADVVFYNNEKGADGAVQRVAGSRLDGATDAESIKVSLDALPADVHKLSFAVAIYDAESRNQNFGTVAGAYIRVVDAVSGRELVRSYISEGASTETALIFGEVYRRDAKWKFKAIGHGFTGGVAPLAKSFGVDVMGE